MSEPSSTSKIRVSLVEDNPASAALLQMVLDSLAEVEFLDCFPSAEQALAALAERLPEVLLVDLHLPGMSGIQLIEEVRSRYPAAQCLVLSGLSDDEAIVGALEAGAIGYLSKGGSAGDLRDALLEAQAGGSPMSPRIARKVVRRFQQT